MAMTHDELNLIAVRWLKRPLSNKGPGCQVALTEVGGLYGGERADAFGYRWGFDGGSIVVESKVSRSDFLADRAKPHRNGKVQGMGMYRYYICPEGLIDIADLPDGWGLLWVNKRGHVKVKAGHIACYIAGGYRGGELAPFWQHDANKKHELDMLAHALVRFGDPEAAKANVRAANREYNRLANEVTRLREDARSYRHDAYLLKLYQKQYGELSKMNQEAL